MKLITFIAAVLTIALVASAEVTSADLKRCPDEHTTLKDVPISYGLSTMERKELERRVNNLEFVLGGCEVEPDSPRVRPTCTTCRFGYDGRSKTWSRSSQDIRTFKRPFSSLLTSFPVLRRPRKVEYEQRVRSGRVVSEEIVYTASQDHPELKARIDQWFSAHHIIAAYTQPKEGTTVRQWEAPGVSIRFSYEPGELFVWLTHDLRAQRPNQSLQRTAGRSDASQETMKTPLLQSTLASASGR
jgi:hypothetical protein